MVDFPVLHTVKGFVMLRNHIALICRMTWQAEVDGDVMW